VNGAISQGVAPSRVCFCIPTLKRPYQQTLDALEASVPLLDAAGIEHCMVNEIGNPYISAARATMLRKALDAKADLIVFIDHDVSWRPADLLKLVQTEGDVVAGTYRFKTDEETYMGTLHTKADARPVVRKDGCIKARLVPAGFLKVTKEAVDRFMTAYPHLCYGPKYAMSVDLFNHGAHEGAWWGEDYAFSRNWEACGGEIWLIPDLDLHHHSPDKSYPGNFHNFLRRQPGGDLAEA
jgi:glycosyltransferase involved in cell wall biosynthesis